MMGYYTTSRDGLLQISEEHLTSVVRKESIQDVYDVDKTPLGRGKHATVCRAVHKNTGVQYAAKFVKKRRRNQDQVKEIIHEIAVLMRCSNTGRVIRLHEVYESPSEMVLVLELAAGGELQHILDGGQCLGETEARKAMKQILEGVAYLHDRNIAHLDLKPQNLLLSVEDCCDDIKLCDFGISKVLEPGVKVREILGTVDYVAPEVLSYDPISLSTDVWSIGVLAYVLLSGFSPFGADDKQQTFLNISKCALSFEPEHFDDVSSAAIDFIKSALVIDPRKRPTTQELLDHPWISLKTNIILPPLPLAITTTPTTTQNHQHNLKSNKTHFNIELSSAVVMTTTTATTTNHHHHHPTTPIIQRKSLSCLMVAENPTKRSLNGTSCQNGKHPAQIENNYAHTNGFQQHNNYHQQIAYCSENKKPLMMILNGSSNDSSSSSNLSNGSSFTQATVVDSSSSSPCPASNGIITSSAVPPSSPVARTYTNTSNGVAIATNQQQQQQQSTTATNMAASAALSQQQINNSCLCHSPHLSHIHPHHHHHHQQQHHHVVVVPVVTKTNAGITTVVVDRGILC